MKVLVFVSALIFSLAVEWLSIMETGLFDKVVEAPYKAFSATLARLVLSGSTVDFLICMGELAIASAAVTVFFWACFLVAYRIARIVSDTFA